MDLNAFGPWLVEQRAMLLTLAFFGSFLGFGMAELWRPRRAGMTAVDRRWLSHLGLVVANIALLELTLGDPFTAATSAHALLPVADWLGDHPALVIVVGVLGADFVRYWVHRINHTLVPLWRLHAVHHADDRPDVTTSFRHHPIEHLMLSASVWIAHGVFGASTEALVIYGVISGVMSPLQHANLRFPARLERAAEWLFVTNALHLSHHSTDPREGGANFGIMFSIWDRLFGTYRAVDPARAAITRYGLDEVPGDSCDRLDAMVLLPIRYPARSSGIE